MWDAWVLVVWCCAMTVGAGRLDSPDLSLLILEEQPSSSQHAPRRITPKSVFVAPAFCSEGYRMDSMGRCVKVVRVNAAAQWDFFLQKLNSMYAIPEPEPPQPRPDRTGPFRVHIPIDPPMPPTTTETPPTYTEPPTSTEMESTTTEVPSTLYEDIEEEEETTEPPTSTTQTSTMQTTTITEEPPLPTTMRIKCRPGVAVSHIEDSSSESLIDCDPAASSPLIRFPSHGSRVRFPSESPYWWPATWEIKTYPTSYQRLQYHHRRRPQSRIY